MSSIYDKYNIPELQRIKQLTLLKLKKTKEELSEIKMALAEKKYERDKKF